jgi:hypothetical protein
MLFTVAFISVIDCCLYCGHVSGRSSSIDQSLPSLHTGCNLDIRSGLIGFVIMESLVAVCLRIQSPGYARARHAINLLHKESPTPLMLIRLPSTQILIVQFTVLCQLLRLKVSIISPSGILSSSLFSSHRERGRGIEGS